ncbi:MAG: hypothetical protein ACU0FH_12270 [Heliomarina sp.]|uniref:hypothetical protein n=1 Tax=Heliomarina sp. TaxID=2917556 RepID=UPI004057EC70
MIIAIFVIGISLVLLVTGCVFAPSFFFGDLAKDIWSFVGVFLSYMGAFFSTYALLEVRALGKKYFAKQRLPELKKELSEITRKLDSLKERTLKDILGEGFAGTIRVILKQLEKTRAPGFTEVVTKTKNYCSSVESAVAAAPDQSVLLRDVENFWLLYTALTELIDEINAYEKEARASL